MATGPDPALSAGEFATAMAALGPFEAEPHIAVACSGGADSMALSLLGSNWVRKSGGKLTVLTVDHGLRANSADEARQVKSWLTEAGIAAVTLRWNGPYPESDIQAAARQARYALLRDWCRAHHVLHLLLAHHQQDQAETFLLRLARGSGVDGLSAMAPLRETPDTRLLRPLLSVPQERLVAYLGQAGQPFVRDPSNEDRSFARVRMRKLLPLLGGEGMTAERLARTAGRMARAGSALEDAGNAAMAASAAIYPEGYAVVRAETFHAMPEEVSLRALARLLCCIGGNLYGPRLERLERLYRWLLKAAPAGGGRTLAGCRILHRRDGFLFCREAAAMQGHVAASDGVVWDNRFLVTASTRTAPSNLQIGPLGKEGWAELASEMPGLKASRLPAPVRWTLPALRALDEIVAVPHLNYRRTGSRSREVSRVRLAFRPARTLTKSGTFARTGFT